MDPAPTAKTPFDIRGRTARARRFTIFFSVSLLLTALSACKGDDGTGPASGSVPRDGRWGIYELNLSTAAVGLIYGTDDEIQTSALRLNAAGDRLAFAQKVGGTSDEDLEIYSIGTDGQGLTRLTDNDYLDVYPAWSPDGARIAYLSRPGADLDIWIMDAEGGDPRELYDSGYNDGDIDWAGQTLVFTSRFAIWKMNADGTGAVEVTDPPHRGEWGEANYPAGDYDPRLSPDGATVVFERLEDTSKPNGGYDLFTTRIDGSGETRLTDTGYAQGLASWSRAGDRLIYVVAAKNGQGLYHMFMIRPDGTTDHDITPDYFPAGFLCQSPVFSRDDASIYFIGQWWQ